jgi:hypothetical protein
VYQLIEKDNCELIRYSKIKLKEGREGIHATIGGNRIPQGLQSGIQSNVGALYLLMIELTCSLGVSLDGYIVGCSNIPTLVNN